MPSGVAKKKKKRERPYSKYRNGAFASEDTVAVPLTLKTELVTMRTSNSFPRCAGKRTETEVQTNTYTSMFIATLFIIAKRGGAAHMSIIDEWRNRM